MLSGSGEVGRNDIGGREDFIFFSREIPIVS
jgi:hypothetical protein